jgi:hypothetical protein
MNEVGLQRRSSAGTPPPNGNSDLPEHRQKQVEAGLAQYQAILAERDTLQNRLKDALVKIEAQEVQLGALQGVVNMMESTMTTYRIQRDEAVVTAASLREAFETICLIAQKHTSIEPTNEG